MEEETKKKINKKNIIKYAGIGLVAAGMLTLGTMSIYDNGVNHLEEYCPLNRIFGIEHQVSEINNNYSEEGIQAYCGEDGWVQIKSAPEEVQEDGEVIYIALDGYMKLNGELVKNVRVTMGEDAVVITKGTTNSNGEVYDPQIINVLTAPKKIRTQKI